MKLRFVMPLFFVVVLGIIISGFNGSPDLITSTGAPPSHTGAPGESTCGRSGCHSDGIQNSGSAISSLSIGENFTEYQPGTTYDLSILITDSSIQRFGFELTAIVDKDSSFAGNFIVTDPDRTQVFSGNNEFSDRNYLTYTFNGTAPFNVGEGKWTAEWIAPSVDVGSITFYLSTVAANNDFTDDGDDVYFSQYQLTEGTATSLIDARSDKADFNIYLSGRSIFLKGNEKSLLESFTIYSIDGKIIAQSNINATSHSFQLDDTVKPGVYVVLVNANSKSPRIKKLMIF